MCVRVWECNGINIHMKFFNFMKIIGGPGPPPLNILEGPVPPCPPPLPPPPMNFTMFYRITFSCLIENRN